MAAIKEEQFLGEAVAQPVADPPLQVAARRRRSEPFAFEAEERNFIKWIDSPQAWIELEAIDNSNRIAEPDVFRSQVAVPIDNLAAANSAGEQLMPRS